MSQTYVNDYMYMSDSTGGTTIVNNSHTDTNWIKIGTVGIGPNSNEIIVRYGPETELFTLQVTTQGTLSCETETSEYNSASTGTISLSNFHHDLDEWASFYSGSYFTAPTIQGQKL